MPRGRKRSYLIKTAEGVGSALGHVAARVDAWKKERQAIAAHLQDVVASAQKVLKELGHGAEDEMRALQNAVRKGGRPKGYKMSEATKIKLRQAWKKRKSALVKDVAVVEKAARTMSADARAKIAAAQKKRWANLKKD